MKSEQIKITEARANIGVYLQQRFEEITAMYKVVREFKLHESTLLKEIVELRRYAADPNLSFKEKMEIHNHIEAAIPKVLASFESYPELTSNQNFLKLQESIEDNEANIASARKSYNGYVNKYNTSIAMFPAVILAKMFGFLAEEHYDAPQDRLENPLL